MALSTTMIAAAPAAPRSVPVAAKCAADIRDRRRVALAAAAAAALVVAAPPCWAAAVEGFETYFGTAAGAASYGGYGGNSSKQDSAEYAFEVPQGWKERLISKVEKGTNGTDAEFYNPRSKNEKTYVSFLAGFRKLASRDTVLTDLSLSDVRLQDDLSQAQEAEAGGIAASNRTDEATGQLYYDYELDGPLSHGLISVTCANNKLYAHFVRAGSSEWKRDETMLRHIHDSFKTLAPARESS